MSQEFLVWHASHITREQREGLNGHRSAIVWFTGLPSSGKSTIAHAVELKLFEMNCRCYVLDGDNVRHGLSADLGFSEADRAEHLRRVGELTKLMLDAGLITLCAFISPTIESRRRIRKLIPIGHFLEVYCQCPRQICEQRDTKGFYSRAKNGQITNYTGISAPYEEPNEPELVLDTFVYSVEKCVSMVLALLRERNMVPIHQNFAAAGPNPSGSS